MISNLLLLVRRLVSFLILSTLVASAAQAPFAPRGLVVNNAVTLRQLSRVSMAGTYEGLQGLRPGANVRVKPYALANLNKVAGTALDKDYNGGFDVKYGVTSGLTWDFTVNTDFYDGYRRSYTIGGTWRMNEHLNLSLSDSINDIDLPSGSFTTHLVTGRVNFYFSTKVFVNALVQYNTDTNQ